MKSPVAGMDKEVSKLLLQNDYSEIRSLPEYSLIIIEWKRQITFAERQTGYLQAFQAIKRHQATSLLIDNEKIFLFTAQEKTWLAETLLNWIGETNIQRLALVTSDLYKNLTDLGDFVELVKSKSPQLGSVQHEFFIDYGSALIWLQE